VAFGHGVLVAFVIVGGLLAVRHRWVLLPHACATLAVLAVNVAGQPCPLTLLELRLRADAGIPAYPGGFIEHYLVAPLHSGGITPAVRLLIYAAVVLPNVAAYAVSLHRRRPRPLPGH